MAIPVPEKSWTFDVNNHQNSGLAATDMKEILLGWKNAMVATGFWAVMLSSDSVSSGASDLWVDTTDLVWGTTGARSWIVLRNANFFGAGKHLEIMFECRWDSSSFPTNLSLWYSPTGDYSGGNTTTLPTATTSVGPLIAISTDATNLIQRGTGGIKPKNWHFMCSTDGQCTRFFVTMEGFCTTFIAIERMKNPVGGLDDMDTFVIVYLPDVTNIGTIEKPLMQYFNAVSTYGFGYSAGNGAAKYYMTAEFCSTMTINDLVRAPNANDGSQLLLPIGLVTVTNAAWAYGRNGELFDLWWGSKFKKTGVTYPDDGSHDFLQIGHLVVPWDGSKPRITL